MRVRFPPSALSRRRRSRSFLRHQLVTVDPAEPGKPPRDLDGSSIAVQAGHVRGRDPRRRPTREPDQHGLLGLANDSIEPEPDGGGLERAMLAHQQHLSVLARHPCRRKVSNSTLAGLWTTPDRWSAPTGSPEGFSRRPEIRITLSATRSARGSRRADRRARTARGSGSAGARTSTSSCGVARRRGPRIPACSRLLRTSTAATCGPSSAALDGASCLG